MPVGARAPALITGVLVALCVALGLSVRPDPDGFFGPRGLDRRGGVRLVYEAPTGATSELEYPGVALDDASVNALIEVAVSGGVAMKQVREDRWLVDALAGNALVARDEDPRTDPRARLTHDVWRDEEGREHHRYVLEAASRASLDEVLAEVRRRGIEPPPEAELVYEPFTAQDTGRERLQAYLVDREILIDSTMIGSATGVFDPNTGRPIVLLDFTRAGSRRFCDVTRMISGRKLAMLLGGVVRSAPIINGPICGGRASIAMGGADPVKQERERDMIVQVLSQPALPPGGKILHVERVAPAEPTVLTRLERVILGLLAGVGAGLLAWLVLAYARPRRAEPTHGFRGAFPWRRLAITALAPIVLLAGKHLVIPGVEEAELARVTGTTNLEPVSVIALGLAPILVAYTVVELVALIIPALRWRRHDPTGRIALGRATAIVALVLALAEGYLFARYLEGLGFGELVAAPGLLFRVVAALSLAAATLLLAVIAGVISEHGLGNGFGALIATGIVLEVAPASWSLASVLGVATFTTMVIAGAAVLRWRIGEGREVALRLPITGVAPLAEASGAIALVVMLAGLWGSARVAELVMWSHELRAGVARLIVVAIAIPLFAWLFARPQVTARVALQGGLTPVTPATWWRATAITALLVLGTAGLATAAPLEGPLRALGNPVSALLVAAVVLDLMADARARRPRLAVAAVIHQPQYLGVVEHALGEAGLPYHLHASHLRTALAFFGPWAPVHVLVEADRATEARLLLDDKLRASRGTVSPARARG